MTFTSFEKYVYSKKCVKQRLPSPHPSPHPSLQQSRRYFRAEKVTWLRLLFAILNMPIQQIVTKRFVYRAP